MAMSHSGQRRRAVARGRREMYQAEWVPWASDSERLGKGEKQNARHATVPSRRWPLAIVGALAGPATSEARAKRAPVRRKLTTTSRTADFVYHSLPFILEKEVIFSTFAWFGRLFQKCDLLPDLVA